MRMTRSGFALVSAGVLLLALGAQAPATPSGREAAPGPQAIAQAEQAAQAATGARSQVDDEAARLRAALAATRPFVAPARNPFSFQKPAPRAAVTAGVPAPVAATPVAPVAAPPSPPAWPTLVAIIADGAAPATAMLSFDGETAIVSAGQTFVRFRVRTIAADTVELVDLSSPAHATHTLSIR